MYYTCPRRLGTIRSSLARGMRHRHMIILKSVTFTMTTDSPPRAPPHLGTDKNESYQSSNHHLGLFKKTFSAFFKLRKQRYLISTSAALLWMVQFTPEPRSLYRATIN